jgi:hypothetical protein
MAYETRLLSSLKKAMKEIEDAITQKYEYEQEEALTGRLAGAIENIFSRNKVMGAFTTHVFTAKGSKSEEHDCGADLGVVFNVKSSDFNVTKGFLMQSKKEDGIKIQQTAPSILVKHKNDQLLKDQTEKMLKITPDSFVFVYSNEGIFVVPASSIYGSNSSASLYGKRFANFFSEFFMCFIGDTRLVAFDQASLDRLRLEMNLSYAILIKLSHQNIDNFDY